MNTADRPYLLIVDDEQNFSESLQLALEDMFVISRADSIASARASLADKLPDAVLIDLRLPDGSGIELVREFRNLPARPVMIVMTAFAAVDNAVAALKEGAVDYFTKPLDIEKLKRELRVCLENRFLQKRLTALAKEIKKNTPPFATAGEGLMKEIVAKVPVIAPLNIPVLIHGDTGTGKEKLAKWVHSLSGVSGEMVSINCSAIPRDLFESELFGYAKGAFSGAASYKEGLIEQADGGTLFLDEIAELPEAMQAKFLRVLEEGRYYKVGETRERKVNFRLISATNKSLTDPVSNFRQDLYFRINGFSFELPSLKDRKEDIPLLVAAFLEAANREYHKAVRSVAKEVMDRLLRYDWPGNIRELKWTVHRAVALSAGDRLGLEEMAMVPDMTVLKKGAPPRADEEPMSFHDAMERLERSYIERALSAANNNKTEASKALGISVRMLHYKIKQYGIGQKV